MNSPSHVLSNYPTDCQPISVQPLGNAGGLSGAQLWKLTTPRGELCLRRWPSEHPSRERLAYLHAVANLAANKGLAYIPSPIAANEGRTYVVAEDQRLWELTRWMPGQALLARGDTTAEQTTQAELLRKAMRCLAEFHVAIADEDAGFVRSGQSQGLLRRAELARNLKHGELKRLRQSLATKSAPFQQQLETIWHLASPRVELLNGLLSNYLKTPFRLQPCLCDVWHDHVLFENGEVTGIIDFGAMKEDTVAIDIARLVGSVEQHIDDAWHLAIDAYVSERSLSYEENVVIPVFREATIILAGFHWIRWLSADRRTFENLDGVARRLDVIIEGLRSPPLQSDQER